MLVFTALVFLMLVDFFAVFWCLYFFSAQKLAIGMKVCWSDFGLDVHQNRLRREHPWPKPNDVHGLVPLRREHPWPKPDDVHGLVRLKREHP